MHAEAEAIPSDPEDAPEVYTHVHDSVGKVPDRLTGAAIRDLSKLRPGRAVAILTLEWLTIAATLVASWFVYHHAPAAVAWALYPFAILIIGSRQHAFAVLGHDAAHYRFLPNKRLNDWLGDLFIQWPVFISVRGFRLLHGKHHQHTNAEGDGNRFLWKTHDPQGNTTPEWTYPKTGAGIALKIFKRAFFFTGLFWILRGLIGPFVIDKKPLHHLPRVLYYAAITAAVIALDVWQAALLLWIVPFCTWHIASQYIRLIAEHSAIHSELPEYGVTRTTIPPLWQRWLFLPHNIGYHIEHHWYPSVPFYNLPALHERLMEQPRFKANANVQRSVFSSLGQCAGATQTSTP